MTVPLAAFQLGDNGIFLHQPAELLAQPIVLSHIFMLLILEAGVDLQYIKDLLGHSDIKTTEVYTRLTIKMKQKLLEEVHPQPSAGQQLSWTADDNLMQWLNGLHIPTD